MPIPQKKQVSRNQQPLSQSQKFQLLMERAVEKKMIEWTEDVFPEIMEEILARFFPDQAQVQEQMGALQEALMAFQRLGGAMPGQQRSSTFSTMRQAQVQRNQGYNPGKYGNRGVPEKIQKEVYNVGAGLDESGILGNPGLSTFVDEDEDHIIPMQQQMPSQSMGGLNVLELVDDTEFSSDDVQALNETQMMGHQMMQGQMQGGMQQYSPQQFQQMQGGMQGNGFNTQAAQQVNAEEFARSHTLRDYADPQEIMNGYNQIASRANAEAERRAHQQQ